MFIAIDGNSTGKIIEKMILDNELEKLSSFSSVIQKKIQSISKSIIQQSGKIIMAGGDNVLAEVPTSSYCKLLRKLDLLSIGNFSFALSISTTIQGAYWGLKYAKAANMAMVEVSFLEDGMMKFSNFEL